MRHWSLEIIRFQTQDVIATSDEYNPIDNMLPEIDVDSNEEPEEF